MSNIEFVVGAEWHSSYWGKFYIKGLEKWEAREDHALERRDSHHKYTCYVCLDIPEGTMFSVFEQNGNKRGTDEWEFTLCIATDEVVNEDKAGYGNGFVMGNYREVVRASGKTKAPRLMNWWQSVPHTLKAAEWCAQHINRRGLKELPSMPE